MGRIGSVLLALSLPSLLSRSAAVSLRPSLSLSRLAFSLLSPSLTHAVSEQTVLSRSISGCHAADGKNKIKNREREKERYFPAA